MVRKMMVAALVAQLSASALSAASQEVVFENERIRALRIDVTRGASVKIAGGPSLIYCISEGALSAKIGSSQERLMCDPDTVFWNDVANVRLTNKESDSVVILAIEMKAPPGGTPAADDDATRLAPDSYRWLFENDHVRVLRFRQNPGARIATHSLRANTLRYPLRDAKERLIGSDSSTFDLEEAAGTPRWVGEPMRWSIENIGASAVDTIIFELK